MIKTTADKKNVLSAHQMTVHPEVSFHMQEIQTVWLQ